MSRTLLEVVHVETGLAHSDAHERGVSVGPTPGEGPATITLRIGNTAALVTASTARVLAEALRQLAIEIDRPRLPRKESP